MKKIYTLLMVSVALLGATSCSDDDDNSVNLATEVAGMYEGYTIADCAYFKNSVSANQSVYLTAEDNDKVTVTYTSDTWGTFTIAGATVSGNKAEYTIVGTGSSLMGHAGNAAKEYECTLTGSIVNGDASFTFLCPSVMGGLTVNFAQGDIPAEIILPGTYSGYTVANATYFQNMVTENQSVAITQAADGTFTLTYTSDTWGTFTINNVQATYADGLYTLAGEGSTQMGMNGSVKEYACTLTGEVNVEKSVSSFLFTVPYVMGGMTIQFYLGEYNG